MQTSRPVFVVSIHDVSPLSRERVAIMLGDLTAAGVGRTSLLVIPDHHHKAAMAGNAAFCGWLQEMAAQGHEIVLHGYFHLRNKGEVTSGRFIEGTKGPEVPLPLTLRQRFTTEFYTAGEGEFYDLSENEARLRLENGLRDFAGSGFHPRGFIAPAWLLGPEAEKAVIKADFDYTTRLQNFKDLKSGRVDASQSLVWSVRAAWRRMVSLWWNAALLRRLQAAPLLRFGLHPPDWDHPTIREQILGLLRETLAGREAITYEEWLERSRLA